MAGFIVLHKQSQLIQTVVTSSTPPALDSAYSFHEASSTVLDKYYRLVTKARRNGVCVNVGDLAAVSPSFLESLKDSDKR